MDFPERIFFITTVTAQRKQLFRFERAAKLFLDTMFGYRDREIFQLYEFVVMPDHVHLILAPKATIALERAMQFIKGGYSHRYMKETGSRIDIWERSFTNHRIRDWDDYETHRLEAGRFHGDVGAFGDIEACSGIRDSHALLRFFHSRNDPFCRFARA